VEYFCLPKLFEIFELFSFIFSLSELYKQYRKDLIKILTIQGSKIRDISITLRYRKFVELYNDYIHVCM